ncbi:hypothetical protein VNO80_30399 [Phaseolus coccineus]|uniref:Uncharacterized protein n=1 Tax=Phaseolus coccineus TaxID=3886 RepID=A0AAN9LHS1_PHACN
MGCKSLREDRWVGQLALKKKYERLYNISSIKEANVNTTGRWTELGWIWDLRRRYCLSERKDMHIQHYRTVLQGGARMALRKFGRTSKALLVKKQNEGGRRRRPTGSSRFSEVSPPLPLPKPPLKFPTAKACSPKFYNSLRYTLRLATHARSAYALSFANLFSKFASEAQNDNNKWVLDINIILLDELEDGNHEKLNLHEL